MKIKIPDQLKEDVPQTPWGKVLTATPVIMTVVATMLAGLSSSEMTRAQYNRALAAQQQSKAGDQWSFFQAKRLRGALQKNTVEILQSTTQVKPLDPTGLANNVEMALSAAPASAERDGMQTEVAALLGSASARQAIAALKEGKLPPVPVPSIDPAVKAAAGAIEDFRPEAELKDLVGKIPLETLESSLKSVRDAAAGFDDATRPVNQAIDQVDALLARAATVGGPAITRDFTVARLRYAAARYEVEARLNQTIANLYEIQVRKSNIMAERHHARSQQFFYGMLAAQAAVIIATFAIAARKRNLLWSIAAGAGVLAVLMAIYVYVYV